MNIYAISDIHVDYNENREWLMKLSRYDYSQDVLIIAGDLTDDRNLLKECLLAVKKIFLHVFFVPGNHELWVKKDKLDCSFEKYLSINSIVRDCGVHIDPVHFDSISIVPMLSWYDFSFGTPCEKLNSSWMDFFACKWPNHDDLSSVNKHFLRLNEDHLNIENDTIISFSHFLPRIDLMPDFIPEKFRYIYPVLGSDSLDSQIRKLGSTVHVFGHSHVNSDNLIDGVKYVNNAFAYPSETFIARKQLLCVHSS